MAVKTAAIEAVQHQITVVTGQIVDAQRIATALHTQTDAADAEVARLQGALAELNAGVSALNVSSASSASSV